MLYRVYQWNRRKYTRNTPGGRWVEDTQAFERSYITPEWMEEKTGPAELRFWRLVCEAWVRVKRLPSGEVHFTNIAPDKLEKREETFIPVRIHDAAHVAGWREKQALEEAETQRIIPCKMETPEHVVLEFGEETRAQFDLVTRRWVG